MQTRKTWRYREHHVTFFRGRLLIRGARAVDAPDGWDDGPMLDSVKFDPRAVQVHVHADVRLRVTVDALDVQVEISGEPAGYVRRRVGVITGIESDTWLGRSPAPRRA